MAQSHERIFRCIIRLFGSFPIKTYSNRIPRDVDDLFTYEDVSERVHIIRRLHGAKIIWITICIAIRIAIQKM